MSRVMLASLCFFLGSLGSLAAEGPSVGTGLAALTPLGDSATLFQTGPAALVGAEWPVGAGISIEGQTMAAQTPSLGAAQVLWASGSVGLAYRFPVAPDWRVGVDLAGGYFGAALASYKTGGYGPSLSGGVGVDWNFGPLVSGRFSVDYVHAWDLFSGLRVGVTWWVGGDE